MRSWALEYDGTWRHRPIVKRVINNLLRRLQTRSRPAHLLVLTSVCDINTNPPTVLRYEFARILHTKA